MRVEACEASSGGLRGLRTFGVIFGLCVYSYSNGFVFEDKEIPVGYCVFSWIFWFGVE